jgi:prepilin-type N-terminal cleavage/methylation domain-containing protein
MILGQQRDGTRRSGRCGFTLVEILLVLALLSLLCTLFIANASNLFRSQEKTMNDVFWSAVQAARLQAVEGDRTVELRYDDRKNLLRWGTGETAAEASWPGKKLDFLPVEKRDTMLLGGQLVDINGMKLVRFYADGCVESFRAQLTGKDGLISHLEIDPWTCAPVVRVAH